MILSSRRKFLQIGFVGTVILISVNSQLFGGATLMKTISLVQEDLFPNIPGVLTDKDINAKTYMSFILNHPHVREQDKKFIRDGVKWLNEEAADMYDKIYVNLTYNQRQNVLKNISTTNWGESWIGSILKYIFEAALGDPIYGINKGERGWIWLKHKSGLPRPTKVYI